jgi:hypothetical protein
MLRIKFSTCRKLSASKSASSPSAKTLVASWKRLDLKDDKNWKNIIGQTLQTAEVEWNIYQDIDDRIVACVLHFDTDFVTFFETNSDTNKFYVNKPLPLVNRQTKIENIK